MEEFKMHRLLCLIFFAACAPLVVAQDTPRVEVFAGYSNLRNERITRDDFATINGLTPTQFKALTGLDPTPNSGSASLHGFDTSVTAYVTRRFGITGDFSGNFKTETETFFGAPTKVRMRVFNALVGPQVKFCNKGRATPFVRALFGAAHFRNDSSASLGPLNNRIIDNYTNFAMAVGGGLDVRVSDRISLRLIQVDYNPAFLKDRTVPDSLGNVYQVTGNRRNNVRFAFGIVLR
jgi:opacity protein-like surface antigen